MSVRRRVVILLILGAAFANMIFAMQASRAAMQAQRSDVLQERVQDQAARLGRLESAHNEFRVQVGDRLARLEAVAEVNNKLLIGIFISIVLMIVGGGISVLRARPHAQRSG